MKRLFFLNNLSGICFLLSSLSLLGVPFLDTDDGFTVFAYMLACVFWIGLIAGIILQIYIAMNTKKRRGKKNMRRRERLLLIPIAFFFLMLCLILTFLQEYVIIMSIDLTCLFFSTEMFFYIKRRYSI